MLSENIDDTLRDYFNWASVNNPADLDYPHVESVRRLLGGGVGCEGLSDEEALFVNRALAILRADNPAAYSLIKRVYGERKSVRWLESRGHGNRKVIARRLAEGREYLRGVITGAIYAGLKSGVPTADWGTQ